MAFFDVGVPRIFVVETDDEKTCETLISLHGFCWNGEEPQPNDIRFVNAFYDEEGEFRYPEVTQLLTDVCFDAVISVSCI